MKLALITPQIAAKVLGQHFNDYKHLPANSIREGIMLGWHADFIEACDLLLRQFLLSMTVHPTWEASPLLITMVNGPSEDAEESKFLDELLSITPSTPMQWLVLGHFNLIYEAWDKNNMNLNRQLMGQFQHTLDRWELFEFALQNRWYTWSNERVQLTLV
jgi:hypothetical protein